MTCRNVVEITTSGPEGTAFKPNRHRGNRCGTRVRANRQLRQGRRNRTQIGTSAERSGAATCSILVHSPAVGSDAECRADLAHPRAAQRSKALNEHADRDRLHGVKIDRAPAPDRVIAGFENDLARQAPNRGRAWRHQRPAQTRDRGIAGEHDYWPSTNLGRFTPPQLASSRDVRHVTAAALRNESRSPHSSASSIGWSA